MPYGLNFSHYPSQMGYNITFYTKDYEMPINQADVTALFTYEPYAGKLYKNVRVSKKPITAQFVHIELNGKIYHIQTSTLIWLYMKGTHNPYVKRIDKDYRNNFWWNFKIK